MRRVRPCQAKGASAPHYSSWRISKECGVLALEIAKESRATKDRSRIARSHPADELGKPKVGSVPYPWRTAHAWLRGRPVDGLEIHGAGRASVARLENVPSQPRAGDCRDRSVCGADRDL